MAFRSGHPAQQLYSAATDQQRGVLPPIVGYPLTLPAVCSKPCGEATGQLHGDSQHYAAGDTITVWSCPWTGVEYGGFGF